MCSDEVYDQNKLHIIKRDLSFWQRCS